MARLHAIEYLGHLGEHPPRPVCVAFGDDLFLRRQVLLGLRHTVLEGDEGDFSLTSFEGRTAEFREVAEELTTLAMFGPRRLVVVDEADEFVSRFRQALEDYVARPGRSGILLLDVKSWPGTTRLYKAVDAHGLAVDCSAPAGAKLTGWLSDWARQTHKSQLPRNAADLLVETVGPELGLLDQELAKLALMAGSDKKITPEMVQKMVGGWRAKTTWVMLDLALDGNVTEAMRQIDRLLAAGEAPIGVLAQISASLRRLAAATRLILQSEAAGRRIGVGPALQQAGVNKFYLEKTEQQLRRLGRQRGSQLYRWLLDADLDLKGDSQMPPRLILERLIVRLAPASQGPPSAPAVERRVRSG
ncbi:MAG: DNA polymerase III subunit delta [Thermoguttaceae bacterium]